MKLSELKTELSATSALNFVLPNGNLIPQHFHITEVGLINKHFIDCGGTVRKEQSASFQVWVAQDTDHRLSPASMLKIIGLSEKVLEGADPEIEVEYQLETIGKYALAKQGENFMLVAKHTDCLAKDNCGAPVEKKKLQLQDLSSEAQACCTPGGGCC